MIIRPYQIIKDDGLDKVNVKYSKEDLIKALFHFFEKLSRKRKIQLGIVLLIAVSIGILFANKFFNIFAEGNDIFNTATIYYNEGGVDKSAQSNTVITELITPSPSLPPSPSPSPPPSPSPSPPPPTPSLIPSPTTQIMQITLTLQGRTDYSVSNGSLRIYTAGTNNVIYENNNISLPSNGQGQVTVSGLIPNQFYDCKFKAPYFLTSLVANVQYSNNFGAIFGVQPGGDLDNNNIINSIDFAILSNKWGQADPISDINKDGTVNSVDFSILNSNWFLQGK